jgi:hypothetical protein
MISKLCVIFVALGFTLMGIMGLVDPEGTLAYLSAGPLGENMRNEVRGVYGGLGLAVAGLLVYSIRDGVAIGLATGIRIGMAGITAGIALGRLVSWIVDGGTTMTPVVFFVGEMLVAVLLVMSIRLDTRRPQ